MSLVRSLVVVSVLSVACAEPDASRAAFVRGVMARADLPLLRTRPAHVAGKYARMSRGLYDFYRGTVPVFRADFANGELPASRTAFAVDDLLVLSTGDAHPENFGLLLAGDGTLAIEPNDFDSADRYPYHWDLRRLATGLAIGVRLARPGEPETERSVARAAALGYADEIRRQATGYDRFRLEAPGDVPHFADLFRRGNRDLVARAELDELTTVRDGVRSIVRGALSSSEPEEVFLDLPPFAREALPDALEGARTSLVAPPPTSFFAIKDAVRQLGSGVASWPRIRVLVLVEGASASPDDDVLLEVKELSDSAAEGWVLPRRYHDDVATRVRETSRAMWARPDGEALWGTGVWLGLDVQVRLEAEAQKTLRVDRFEDELAEPEALVALAERLGALLARLHATPTREESNPAARIAARLDDATAFADEHASASVAYADQVEADFAAWRGLVCADPTLGVHPSETDRPSDEVRAVLGEAVPVRFDFCGEDG
ncbi:MAG: DUF2252 family protein [Sandaracinus sp.]|nr:DUF2252 family protein [Myxococcales bacterium]MCB9635595.1 DUF2252 family protein [Sandaracinus sp.]